MDTRGNLLMTHIVFTGMWFIALSGSPLVAIAGTAGFALYWVAELLALHKESPVKAERRRNREWCAYLERSLNTATDPVHREAAKP
jgi:hypothetical protein